MVIEQLGEVVQSPAFLRMAITTFLWPSFNLEPSNTLRADTLHAAYALASFEAQKSAIVPRGLKHITEGFLENMNIESIR